MVIMTVFIVTCIWTRRLIISCAFNLYYFCSYVCVLVCMSSPLGWCRTPRARTRCQCYISPSETEWMRTAPPTGCNIAWSRLRRFPSGRIWSRRWPQKRCRPNCPGRGRTAPLVAWRSWCDEPVSHQHHLKRKDADHYIQYMFMWTFIMEHNNIQSAKEFFFINMTLIYTQPKLLLPTHTHTHYWTQSLKNSHILPSHHWTHCPSDGTSGLHSFHPHMEVLCKHIIIWNTIWKLTLF